MLSLFVLHMKQAGRQKAGCTLLERQVWVPAVRFRCDPQIRLGPPLFVPNGQIGSFGSVSQIRSLVGSRADLFDYAFAGPAAAGAISALLFLVGLGLSTSGLPKVRMLPVTPGLLAVQFALPLLIFIATICRMLPCKYCPFQFLYKRL
jgi:hypothetical protein